MKAHILLAITLLFNTSTLSIVRAESKELEHINRASLQQFEKSVLVKYDKELSYSIRDIKTGKEISAVQGDKSVKPASVQKLVTSYAALKELGGEYVFHTDFYYSEKTKALTVKGYGDPVMTDERLYKVVDDLYRSGITKIERVIIDDSSFTTMIPRSGLNPYQAAQSAITLNFNTVNLRGQLIGDRRVFSTTTFYPLDIKPKLSIGKEVGVYLLDNGKSVSITLNKEKPVVEDNLTIEDPADYFAQILIGFLKLRGIATPGSYIVQKGLTTTEPTVISSSKSLAEIIADMNRYSSNFLAGQITYQLGRIEGDRYDYNKGLTVVSKYIDGPVTITDGSGLSHENRLTVSALSKVIVKAM